MARFNLQDYEQVDSRIRRLKADYPCSDINTEIIAADCLESGKTRWVVMAKIWKEKGYERPDATGLAFEIDGEGGMANKTSALENAETSATGRALANLNYSGNKRATREEMLKVKGAEVREQIAAAQSENDLNRIYAELQKDGIEKEFLGDLGARKKALSGAS